MMRIIRRIYVMLLVVILLMTMIGCRYTPADDPRLMFADSLMEENPDSAYALLSDIVPVGKSNTAYHALLLTQSTIKSYNEITSDSLINISMDYYGKRRYTDEDARRLYVRSRIFKGKVLSLLNRTDDALDIELKTFEYIDSTNPVEYILMGELNHQIAGIYYLTYSNDSIAVYRYRKAVFYYQKADKAKFVNNDLKMLGAAYARINMDSALKYLKMSLQMSEAMQDSSMIVHQQEYLSKLYSSKGEYNEAKKYALKSYKANKRYGYDTEVCYDLCLIYYKENNLDSARYFSERYLPDTTSADELYRKLLTKNLIAKLENDYSLAYRYLKQMNLIADSIQDNDFRIRLNEVEKKYNLNKAKTMNLELKYGMTISIAVSIILVFGLLLYRLYVSKQQVEQQNYLSRLENEINKNKERIEILKNQNHQLEYDKTEINDKVETLQKAISSLERKEIDSENRLILYDYYIRLFIEKQLENYRDLIDLQVVSTVYKNNPQKILDKILPKLSQITLQQEFWESLRKYINTKYNGLLDSIVLEYPYLKEEDINLMAMYAYGSQDKEASIYLGYKHDNSASTRSGRLKTKMKLKVSLRQYIKERIEKTESYKKVDKD